MNKENPKNFTLTAGSEPQQERSKQTVQKILTVATKLFLNQGVAAVTLGQIAGKAKVPTSTIYRYFPSKGGVVAQLMRKSIGDLLSNAQKQFDSVRNIEEFASTLNKVLWEVFEQVQERPLLRELYGALLSERSLKEILISENEQWIDMYFMAARRFIDTISDEDLRLRIRLLNEMWDGTIQLAIWSGKEVGKALMKEAIAISCRELGLPAQN